MLDTNVFDSRARSSEGGLSDNAFYGIMSLVVLWGLAATGIFAKLAIDWNIQFNLWTYLLVGLGIPVVGIILALSSDNPVISFIGYNLLVIPFGFVLGPALKAYSATVIVNAAMLTGGVTILMGLAGLSFPKFFSQIGGVLFMALTGLLIMRIVQIFVPAWANMTWVEYVAAGIFSLYIGYDMYRASVIERTVDNAIDVAVQLYLDILNLFLTILRIMGAAKGND